MEKEKEKKEITLNECLQRAEAADNSQMYSTAANYYFIILSRFLPAISKDKKKCKDIVHKFIIDTIMLQNRNQKDKLLNFLSQNDNLNVGEYKKLFEKLFNHHLVYVNELKTLMSNCPSSHKNFNIEKALFEHNLYSLSKVFDNISFSSLEKFLQLKIDTILKYMLNNILEGALKAEIDEGTKYVTFIKDPEVSTEFDQQIRNFCLKAKNLGEYIKNK